MLEPGRRRLFLDTLRPPGGYLLSRAVGTTFTLDLMALLSVPLAFTFRDAQDGEGQLATEPLSLLESARRYAGRIVVFSQGGYTGVPRADQPALAFIEESVVAVFPPRRSELGAIFHPKVWVLRYVRREETGDHPVRYRLVTQSRNLTFDSSWDVSLVLDGELNESRVNAYSINRPLSDFIRRLPALASGPVSESQQESIDLLSDELLRVRWSPPDGLELSRFLPFGVRRTNPQYPDLDRRRLLVISPFLDGEFLRSVTRRRRHSVLISRKEALLTVSPDAVRSFERVYAFRSALEPEPEDTDESLTLLAGLHAKVFVIDDGWNARVAVGSANSTAAALGNPPRNIEFMVELVGKRSRFGIDALLRADREGEPGTFSSLIEEFDPDEAGMVTEDEHQMRLERLLDHAAQTLARVDLGGKVAVSDNGRYSMRLEPPEVPDLDQAITDVRCWPATLSAAHGQPFEGGAEFKGLSLAELSAFLAIEVRASLEGRTENRRFARTIRLSGLPEDRLPRLIAAMLRDRRRLMQLLWLLLSPDQEVSFADLSGVLANDDAGAAWGAALPGLLERMLETLGSDPHRLDDVNSLIEDLRSTEAGTELIGTEFEAVWDALWTARGRLK